MLRPATRVDVRQIMEQERAELVRLNGTLTEEESSLPTVCDGWAVRDLAVHLLGVDLSFLSRNRDGHRNEGLGPGGVASPGQKRKVAAAEVDGQIPNGPPFADRG